MSIIVTDQGFQTDPADTIYLPARTLGAEGTTKTHAVDVPSDLDPATLAQWIEQLTTIRVDFPSFADGRGFTIARQLRLMGYKGHLRASGHVLADQYTMARRSGFDDVEIDHDLARRQSEDQWAFRSDWQKNDYQMRLRA